MKFQLNVINDSIIDFNSSLPNYQLLIVKSSGLFIFLLQPFRISHKIQLPQLKFTKKTERIKKTLCSEHC